MRSFEFILFTVYRQLSLAIDSGCRIRPMHIALDMAIVGFPGNLGDLAASIVAAGWSTGLPTPG